jgi:hypothetical protein
MTKKTIYKFTPTVCQCCGMTLDYTVSLDKGTAELLLAMIGQVSRRNQNEVYLQEEVKKGNITPMQAGNLTKARAHGLIAPVRGKSANYLITRKGADFLRGKTIPRVAIVSKKDDCQIGYFHAEEITININEAVNGSGPYWEFLEKEYPQSGQATLAL